MQEGCTCTRYVPRLIIKFGGNYYYILWKHMPCVPRTVRVQSFDELVSAVEFRNFVATVM